MQGGALRGPPYLICILNGLVHMAVEEQQVIELPVVLGSRTYKRCSGAESMANGLINCIRVHFGSFSAAGQFVDFCLVIA